MVWSCLVGGFFGMYVLPMLGVTVARKARREGKRFQNEVYVLLMRGLPSLAPRSFAHVPVRCFRLSCPLPCSRPAGWPLWTESRSYFVAILEPLFFNCYSNVADKTIRVRGVFVFAPACCAGKYLRRRWVVSTRYSRGGEGRGGRN